MSAGNNRIAVPGRIEIACKAVPGPGAYPVHVTIAPPGEGPQIVVFGGLTKLEWMAGQAVSGNLGYLNSSGEPASAVEIVDVAQAILAECERRQTQERADAAPNEATSH